MIDISKDHVNGSAFLFLGICDVSLRTYILNWTIQKKNNHPLCSVIFFLVLVFKEGAYLFFLGGLICKYNE